MGFHVSDLIRTDEEKEVGAADGTRTRDIQLGKLTLYQLSYSRSQRAKKDP